MEMPSGTLSQEREGMLISWNVMAHEYDKFTKVAVSFIKMHKGRLTTYNASRANKINVV